MATTIDGYEGFNHPDLPCLEDEEIQALFKKHAPRYSKEFSATLLSLIENEKISIVASDTEGGKLAEDINASNIHDGVMVCLRNGGELLEAVVGSNFSLSEMTARASADYEMAAEELENQQNRLRLAESASDQPPVEKIFGLRAKAQGKKEIDEVYDRLYAQWLHTKARDDTDKDDTEAKARGGKVGSATKKPRQIPWENSPEYELFIKEKEKITQRMEELAEMLYLEAYNVYEKEKELKCELQGVVSKGTKDLKNKGNLLELIKLIQLCIKKIVGKVAFVVDKNAQIKLKLQGSVHLTTGSIVNPLDGGNLTGILAILFHKYCKSNIARFCNNFHRLVTTQYSEQMTREKMEVIIDKSNKTMKNWMQLDLMKQMTYDRLFSTMLVHSLHPNSEVKAKAWEHLITEAERIDSQPKANDDETPLYHSVTRYIEDVYTPVKSLSEDTSRKSTEESQKKYSARTGNASQGNNFQVSSTTPMSKPSGFTPRGLESAAAATVKSSEATGTYDGEVTKDQNLFVRSLTTGQRHSYTATSKPCPNCTSKDKNTHCQPYRCYGKQCSKCKLWGHKVDECHQKLPESGSSGEKL
jgi:hypothetical protein